MTRMTSKGPFPVCWVASSVQTWYPAWIPTWNERHAQTHFLPAMMAMTRTTRRMRTNPLRRPLQDKDRH
eukprot:scaffold104943_cov54-Attheya_sp.AAC.4